MSRVLVTGASGFVGSAVVRALLARGEEVRALARSTSPKTNLQGLGCEIVLGDLKDPASLRRAMDGCEDLFHVAADYRLWARNPEEIIANNREGTRNVLDAAKQAGVRRIVYTSSVATLKPRSDGGDADERNRASFDTAIGAYKKSKVAAERLVEEYAAQGLPVVLVSPSTPIGPRDVRPTPTGRIIVEAARGRIPAFVDTGLNLVHVDDVAEGHLRARAHGRVGETYILGGQNATLQQMLAEIAHMTGRRPPAIRLPRVPLYPIALLAEAAAALSGKEPFVTRDALAMSRQHMFFSYAKAAAELGYQARPYQEALRDALAWFHAQGYLT
ncbi:MAG: NAD-dependent epimerase/dehydratase family protein [Alphaproteobacteria bacterium]|nr:NAD-dependent epimerase/dehydratase family protein [Alphaproteobacteria bacterium]